MPVSQQKSRRRREPPPAGGVYRVNASEGIPMVGFPKPAAPAANPQPGFAPNATG
jgi:hypothetical protein